MTPSHAPRSGAAAAKLALRDQLLAARRRIPLPDLGDHARAIADHLLATVEGRRAATVAAYASVGREPGTTALLDRLRDSGKRVLLPVLLPDDELDWALYEGPESLAAGGRGLLEPVTARFGVEALSTADLVLVPGLAVSRDGDRLGRGGGSYDRALRRVPEGTPIWVLLYDDEVGVDVPVEPHDRPVTAAVSPRGLVHLGGDLPTPGPAPG